MDLNPMAECLKPAALLTASKTCNLCLKLVLSNSIIIHDTENKSLDLDEC